MVHIFEEVLFFQATYNTKTEKQTIYLADGSLMLGGWQKVKGTRLMCHALFFITSLSCPFPTPNLPASNWRKLSELIVCFYVFMLCVAWKKRTSSKIPHFVLICPLMDRSLEPLVCFGSLFRMLVVNSVSDFQQRLVFNCKRPAIRGHLLDADRGQGNHEIFHPLPGIQFANCKYPLNIDFYSHSADFIDLAQNLPCGSARIVEAELEAMHEH